MTAVVASTASCAPTLITDKTNASSERTQITPPAAMTAARGTLTLIRGLTCSLVRSLGFSVLRDWSLFQGKKFLGVRRVGRLGRARKPRREYDTQHQKI